jgi:hypothetical protein
MFSSSIHHTRATSHAATKELAGANFLTPSLASSVFIFTEETKMAFGSAEVQLAATERAREGLWMSRMLGRVGGTDWIVAKVCQVQYL